MIDSLLLDEYTKKIDALIQQETAGNADVIHSRADKLLCELLEKLGYNEIVKKFFGLERWYG